LCYEEKYHFSECLYRNSHKKESKDTDDEMCSCFTETLDEIPTEHDHYGCDEARESDRYNTIDDTIPMHSDDVCDTRSWKCEGECERYDESFIEVFMEYMISLDFIYLGSICFFSLDHRESDEKEYDRSGDTEILSLEPEKSEHILPEKKCHNHPDKYHHPDASTIPSEVSHRRTRMEFRIEWECREWLEESYECEEHDADEREVRREVHEENWGYWGNYYIKNMDDCNKVLKMEK
jgi:hypothetical protein